MTGAMRDYDEEALRQRLATDPRVLEPELEVRLLDDRVVVGGVVPTQARHASVLAVVRESVGGLPIEDRLVIAAFPPPAEGERPR